MVPEMERRERSREQELKSGVTKRASSPSSDTRDILCCYLDETLDETERAEIGLSLSARLGVCLLMGWIG